MPPASQFHTIKNKLLLLFLAMLPGLTWADSQINLLLSPQAQAESYSNQVQNALLAHYANWEGTRYKLGGTGPTGVDCSSFIQTLFQDKFQLDLPRTSREQMAIGEPVNTVDLRTGDLLFFRTGPTRRHVGVYMGNNEFLHVSTRAGVQIAKLLSPYWQRHFISARRVVSGGLIPSN